MSAIFDILLPITLKLRQIEMWFQCLPHIFRVKESSKIISLNFRWINSIATENSLHNCAKHMWRTDWEICDCIIVCTVDNCVYVCLCSSYRFILVRVWSQDCSAVLLLPDKSRPPLPVYVNSSPSSYTNTYNYNTGHRHNYYTTTTYDMDTLLQQNRRTLLLHTRYSDRDMERQRLRQIDRTWYTVTKTKTKTDKET